MLLKRIQLGLIHVPVAISLVPLHSTLNRVMIKELAISATLVAILASLPYLLAPSQVAIGSYSDRHPILGYRRSPYILAGLLLCVYDHLLNRRFEEAIDLFLVAQRQRGVSDGLASALASAYRDLGFQTLANQVRRSVRSVRGNQWMFRIGHPADQPLRVRPELMKRPFPILRERTPVRMDLSHSGWSDIFFLGMDFPEAARVLNISVDLGVHGRDASPVPPVEACLRVIDEPLLRLTSVDLGQTAYITALDEVFDFAKDFSPEAMRALSSAPWNGNVRELRNLVESVVVLAPSDEIGLEHLPDEYRSGAGRSEEGVPAPPPLEGPAAAERPLTMEEIERKAILSALARSGGNRTQAAEALGIGLRTLQRKLKEYGVVGGGRGE